LSFRGLLLLAQVVVPEQELNRNFGGLCSGPQRSMEDQQKQIAKHNTRSVVLFCFILLKKQKVVKK
jgi:hypothetical protein